MAYQSIRISNLTRQYAHSAPYPDSRHIKHHFLVVVELALVVLVLVEDDFVVLVLVEDALVVLVLVEDALVFVEATPDNALV